MTLELKVEIGSKYDNICAQLMEGISKNKYTTHIISARGHACYFCGNKVELISVLVEKVIVDSNGQNIGRETFVLDQNCYFSVQKGEKKLPYKSRILRN